MAQALRKYSYKPSTSRNGSLMNGRSFRKARVAVFALFFLIVTGVAAVVRADNLTRELWRGEMTQTSPMPWKGPMEFYLRFDEEDSNPAKISGIITWSSLGQARTMIKGEMSVGGTINFSETSCLSGDCSKVILNGSYQAKIAGDHMAGEATGLFGLKGEFSLNRISHQQ